MYNIVLLITSALSLSCKDMSGKDIPWFSSIKIPGSISPTNGLEFMYLDQNNLNATIQPTLISQPSALSYTISQANNKSLSSILFNDEPPTLSLNKRNYKPTLKRPLSISNPAHAKGVLIYDNSTAVYLVHSIPLYPAVNSDGSVNTTINSSELIYAQNIMCVTLPTSSFFALVGVMSLIQPDVYYKNLVIQNANITSLVSDAPINIGNFGSYSFSVAGLQWTYLAKSQYANLDLWDNVVANYYQQGLEVESWGRPYMASVCPPTNPYSVLNIAGLKIQNYAWKDTQDHSKWGILDSSSIVCYGDMNRMLSQRGRGGGTVCLNFPAFYTLHRKLITDIDPCNT